MTHYLKTLPEYMDAVSSRAKTFEVRKANRLFGVGDKLVLREWDTKEDRFTKRHLACRVTYILPGGQYGIKQGYCVLGIELQPVRSWHR